MNENEWLEFFQKLGDLLNEYNFMISEFTLGKSKDPRIQLIQFNSDGKKVFPVYSIPSEIEMKD